MSLMIEVAPPSLLVKFSFPLLIEQCDLKHVTWAEAHSSLKVSKFSSRQPASLEMASKCSFHSRSIRCAPGQMRKQG